MSNSNVRSYTDQQILSRVMGLPTFKFIPTDYWLVAVRSNEDAPDRFDDKFYLFKGEKFVDVWPCTTNAGLSGLKYPSNPKGCAVLKSDMIYYSAWTRGLHRGKVLAYRQALNLPVYRDTNRNAKAEEVGVLDVGMFGINIHPSSYVAGSTAERELIGPWSLGCLVFAVRADFDKFMSLTKNQKFLTSAVLKEWPV